MQVISVNIQKGGSGKTTTVQVLAEMLSKEHQKKVLCIDTDPQCNLTSVSSIDVLKTQEQNLHRLLEGKATVDECIFPSKYYDIIPGSMLLASADTEFLSMGRYQMIKEILEPVSDQYDFCIIDTPPALGVLNLMSLTASDKVLIPTECSVLAMIGLKQLQNTILDVRKHTNPNLELMGILVVRYSNRATINREIYDSLQSIAEGMGTKVFDTKVREISKIKEAQAQFTPILDYAKGCAAVQDYSAFLEESKLL